jgi:hypothetical protein
VTTSSPALTFTLPNTTHPHTLRFQLSVTDAENKSSTTGIDIQVSANNDPPTAVANYIFAQSSLQEGGTIKLTASGSTDPEGESLNYKWTQTNTSDSPNIPNFLSNSEQPTVTAPQYDKDYTLAFYLEVSDSSGSMGSSSSISILISADNDAPTAVAGTNQEVLERSQVTLNGSGSDPENQNLTYEWTQLSGTSVALTNSTSATATFTAPNKSSDYDLTFKLQVTDSPESSGVAAKKNTNTNTNTVKISVLNNNKPTAITLTNQIQIPEHSKPGTVVGTVSISDDGRGPNTLTLDPILDSNSFILVGNTLQTKAGSSFDFETKPTHSIQIRVTDTTIPSILTKNITITISDENDAPIITAISPLQGQPEDLPTTISYSTLLSNATDADGNTIQFKVISLTSVSLLVNGSPFESNTNHTITTGQNLVWTPAQDQNGTLNAFTIKAFDGTLYSTTPVPVLISVAPDNDKPTLTSISTLQGQPEDLPTPISHADLLANANANDIDGDTIQFKVVSLTSGSLLVNGSPFERNTNHTITTGQNLVWTPDKNINGITAAFTIKAFDNSLLSATEVTVSVNVTPVNDAPTLTTISTLQGQPEDLPTPISYSDLLAKANENDIDGDTIQFKIINLTSGSLLVNGSPFERNTNHTITTGQNLVWTPDKKHQWNNSRIYNKSF